MGLLGRAILETNDALAVQLINYGNGLLKEGDSLRIQAGITVTISKKNDIEALEARLAALELAIAGRFTAVPAMSLLGRNIDTGVIETVPQSNFTTPIQVQNRIDESILSIIENTPETLNTLDELASAINDDANFAVNVTNLIATKATIINSLQLTSRTFFVNTPFNASNWIEPCCAAIKWIDGGQTNQNLPTGFNTGLLEQKDGLHATAAAGKWRVQQFYTGTRLFFRIENNSVWGQWREIASTVVA